LDDRIPQSLKLSLKIYIFKISAGLCFGLRQDIDQLNENFIFSQLTYAGMEMKFWRSKAKAEVDFILDREGLIAIESKSSGRRLTKSLLSFKEKYKPSRTIVACKDTLKEEEDIIYVPFVFIASVCL
jgi:predicted AAA+ superfamily ATPase